MGSGASTTTTKVERIRIDSNGDIWKKKKNGTEKLCRPTSGMRPISGIQRRIQNRSNSIHSNKGKDINGSNEKLNSNIENLKFLQNELEEEVERLKHEIQRLEWEKAELINDVAFQKNEMQHSSNDVNGFFKGQTINEENVVSAQSKMDQKLYENLIQKLQNQLKEEQERHQKRLEFERELREKMEDVVRIHLGDAFLFDAKNSFAHDTLPIVKSFEGVKPFCRNLLSSHGRLSTPGNTSTNFVETIEEEPGEERSTSQAEIMRIHDDGSEFHKIRPSTADVNTGNFKMPVKIGRGESAPTLFKLSKSREKRSQWRKKNIDGDKESIDSHSIEDEIDDILSGSFSSISNSISSNKHRSAKSRDSGYLGESANFDADSSKLDVLNLP